MWSGEGGGTAQATVTAVVIALLAAWSLTRRAR